MADIYHKKDSFHSQVNPLPVQYDDVQQQARPAVQVLIHIHYQIKRFFGKISHDKDKPQETALLDRSEENVETTCRFYLDDDITDNLNLMIMSYMPLISPELSKLGVKPNRHKGIVKKIINCCRMIAAAGAGAGNPPALMVPMQVVLHRVRTRWRCDICSREKARKLAMRKLLEVFRFGEGGSGGGGNGSSGRCCTICLEEFVVGGNAMRLPCLHEFHDKCIVTWLLLRSTPSCPLCRFQIPPFLITKTRLSCHFSNNNI